MANVIKRRGDRFSIENISVSAYNIPTDYPESDGTFEWNSTTIIVTEATAAGQTGIGYTYADATIAEFIRDSLIPSIVETDALSPNLAWWNMVRRIRNLGRPGLASMAISSVDTALWDLKSKLLNVPVAVLLGGVVREGVPIYGSGGFISYSDQQLAHQFGGWVEQGITMVKMKIGRDVVKDVHRVSVARDVIGTDVELFVDANGGYSRKQALAQAEQFSRYDVRWFEEPISSDDLDGLKQLRFRMPANMELAAGEYGYDAHYFRRMLESGAIDVLQADATRCGGFTGFLQAAELTVAFGIPLSTHTAPLLHTHIGCAIRNVRHLEYFHDHVRIERMLFDGVPEVQDGKLFVDRSRPGLGVELKRADAARFAA